MFYVLVFIFMFASETEKGRMVLRSYDVILFINAVLSQFYCVWVEDIYIYIYMNFLYACVH